MARSPHGTESWHLALASLLDFEKRFGPVEAPPPSARASANGDGVFVEALASPASLRAGEEIELSVTVRIAEGTYLAAAGGLGFEAWAGSDLLLASTQPPEPRLIAHEDGTAEPGWEGEAVAKIRFRVASGAARGERALSVHVRYRACGEGVCRPEAILSLSLPITVVA
jgi:hypothetical protein